VVVRLPLIILLVPLLTYAGTEEDIDCSDYYGLNICAASIETPDDQITYVEQNQKKVSPKIAEHAPLFKTSLTDDDMNQLQKENTFKNSDSFRAYMKTLSNTGSTNTSSEFSLKKRILDNSNFGLDCRLVTQSIYEISSSYYYDCAVQRYF
jgi:hypothetical protein